MDSISLPFKDIKPNSSQKCSVAVFDSKHATTTKTFTVIAPTSLPPIPPSGKVICSSQNVIITWPRISQARSYIVFFSDSLHGPYSESINQPDSSIISIITFKDRIDTYFPRYYILASANESGISRSNDTLVGRKYCPDLPTPGTPSVSQGYYPSCMFNDNYS